MTKIEEANDEKALVLFEKEHVNDSIQPFGKEIVIPKPDKIYWNVYIYRDGRILHNRCFAIEESLTVYDEEHPEFEALINKMLIGGRKI